MSPLLQVMFLVLGWLWSGAVETALVDAYQFSGGPLPSRGLGSWQRECSVSGCQAWWSPGSEGTW